MEGLQFGPAWGVPFAGMLLSIALLPLVARGFWHHHYGKVSAFWALAFLLPFALHFGAGEAAHVVVHALLAEYVPFVVLLVALFVAAGGIHIRGNLRGGPALNTALMALGALLANVMGTTGAAMLLIHPLLRANDDRRHKAHVVVFFIFIVGNAGGSLTPLGDPPLFLGFLQGVDFSWTARHLWPQTLFVVGALLLLHWLVDRWYCRREPVRLQDPTPDTPRIGVDGLVNLLPLAAIVGLVLMSGLWKPGVVFDVLGTPVPLQQLVRDGLLVAATLLSLAITPRGVRAANRFSWEPMKEVAKLFAAIFLTMAPVLALLKAGQDGPFAALTRAVVEPGGAAIPAAYFWCTGVLSAFLDNAPTYLVFFNLAGGDAQRLMTTDAAVLSAISAGAVFMGAATYIGNAPNFMVRAIAEERGVAMPSFFGFMGWSAVLLLPLFMALTWIWY